MEAFTPPFFEIYDLDTEIAVIVPQGYLFVPEIGRVSPACYTQEYAHRMLVKFLAQGNITAREAQVLRRQIKLSPLPKRLTPQVRKKLVQQSLYAIAVMRQERDIEGPLWTWYDINPTQQFYN